MVAQQTGNSALTLSAHRPPQLAANLHGPISGDHFARLGLLNGNTQTAGDFYALHGANPVNAGLNEQRVDCRHNDCVAGTLSGISTGASAVTVGCSVTGILPCVAGARLIGTGAGLGGVIWSGVQTFDGNQSTTNFAVDVGAFALGAKYGDRGKGIVGLLIDVASYMISE